MILNQYNPNLSCWYDTTQHAFYGQTQGAIAAGDTVSVVVSCYDFGAHGDIFVEARKDSSSIFMNLTKYMEADSQFVNFTTIPRDEDNTYKDYLADYWEELMLADGHCPDTVTSILQITRTQEMDDYIHPVLPTELGDYLNVFEEYRGFYCRGVHTRTSPWQKDFFIYSNLGKRNLNTGIGYAELIGPKLGHWIDSTEMKNYSEPDTVSYWLVMEDDKAVNCYADRIDSHKTCASAIFLNSLFFDSSKTIGLTAFYPDWDFHMPRTTIVGYLLRNQIRFHTFPNYDTTNTDRKIDSLWQMHVDGHEIGHMVHMPHNLNQPLSIMDSVLTDTLHPEFEYSPEDLENFMVKQPTEE